MRQFARLWHSCPLYQNRDDTNVAGKRCGDFDGNKVVGLLDSRLPRFILHLQPIGTDDDQHGMACSHLAIQVICKVLAMRYIVVDIHKELMMAKLVREPIVQPTGYADGIFSAVIDENLSSHSWSPPKRISNLTAGPVLALSVRSHSQVACPLLMLWT